MRSFFKAYKDILVYHDYGPLLLFWNIADLANNRVLWMSYGEAVDGGNEWAFLVPTPGYSNSVLSILVNNHIPDTYYLFQNYPNPFNPVTTFRYNLPEDELVNITIYDIIGRQIKTLINSSQTAGYKSIQWNATNSTGQSVSAGVYLFKIQAGNFSQTKKMVLLK